MVKQQARILTLHSSYLCCKLSVENLQRKEKPLERAGTAAAINHSDDCDTTDFDIELALDTAPNDDFNMDLVLDTEPESSQTEDSDWDPEFCQATSAFKTSIQSGNGNSVFRIT